MSIVPSFIPGQETVNSAVNGFFGSDSIDVIRSIDYDTKYLWALRIVGNGAPPAPFNTFFPANDVSVPFAISESHTIDFAQSSLQVPLKSTGKEINITFYDNENRDLLNWVSDWINLDIQNNGKFMSGLKDNHLISSIGNNTRRGVDITGGERVVPLRTIELTLLSKYKKVDKTIMYDVFPVGEVPWSGDQSSEAQTYSMRFAIIKEYGADSTSKTSYSDIAKDILGKFI